MPSDKTLLTLDDMCQRLGVTAEAIPAMVTDEAIPAPDRWHSYQGPLWAESALASVPGVTTTSVAMTKQMHLDELFDELSVYALVHGHARPSGDVLGRTRNGRTYPLGRRLQELRRQYRQGKLSKVTIARFESLPNWVWDRRAAEWAESLEDVVSRWPHQLTPEDRTWLTLQRLRWDRLGPERQNMLNAYPGLMDRAPRAKVKELVAAIECWMAMNPGMDASAIRFHDSITIDGKTIPLGKRITYYRRRRRGMEGQHQLSDDDVALLESVPGWQWEAARGARAGVPRRKNPPLIR